MIRNIWGQTGATEYIAIDATGVFYNANRYDSRDIYGSSDDRNYARVGFDASRQVPTGAANKPRAWGALACAYLGTPVA